MTVSVERAFAVETISDECIINEMVTKMVFY